MSSMITTCPGCGRKGIMSKKTGTCVHCSKGSAAKPKVEIVAVPPVTVTSAPMQHRFTVKNPKPKAKPASGRRLVGGRLV